MAADRSYVAQNNAQRERLRALVARLKDEDLHRPLPAPLAGGSRVWLLAQSTW